MIWRNRDTLLIQKLEFVPTKILARREEIVARFWKRSLLYCVLMWNCGTIWQDLKTI